jgi:ElaA protein
MVSFYYKTFEELTTVELHDILALRSEVFVVEQNCVYQDIDGKDLFSVHIIGKEKGKTIAYARFLKKGISYSDYSSVGRVVVSIEKRGEQLGHKLVKFSIKTALKLYPKDSLKISAQAHLQKFYEEHNFKRIGEEYLEDGIPHVGMILKR